jgi:hypothetical protein
MTYVIWLDGCSGEPFGLVYMQSYVCRKAWKARRWAFTVTMEIVRITICPLSLECSTQAPCGFGTSLITQLLVHWKYEGYIRWLRGHIFPIWVPRCSQIIFITGLGTQYAIRRDHFIDCLDDEFELQLSSARNGVWEGCDYYLASTKLNGKQMSEKFGRKTMFSFVPPTSGMFVWVCGLLLHWLSLTDAV